MTYSSINTVTHNLYLSESGITEAAWNSWWQKEIKTSPTIE